MNADGMNFNSNAEALAQQNLESMKDNIDIVLDVVATQISKTLKNAAEKFGLEIERVDIAEDFSVRVVAVAMGYSVKSSGEEIKAGGTD